MINQVRKDTGLDQVLVTEVVRCGRTKHTGIKPSSWESWSVCVCGGGDYQPLRNHKERHRVGEMRDLQHPSTQALSSAGQVWLARAVQRLRVAAEEPVFHSIHDSISCKTCGYLMFF